jgi:outer membrane protein assembly factor BamC
MERAGTQRWLVVPETPEKIWPIVKEFWQESGFLVNLEIPEAGVMETDWAENRAKIPSDMIRSTLGRVLDQVYSTGERDKFRTRLERGSEPNTTEIYISHRGVEEVVTAMSSSSNSPASFVWQPKRPDPDLEAEFLRKLMVRFGVEDNRAREMVAVAPKIERAKYVKAAEGGAGLLELDEPFDRAWRRVGLALDRVGFTVEDRDRSKGFYFVRYLDPESDAATKKNDGVLSKLAFWRSDKPAAKSEQYRVLVKESKDTSQVQVLNKEGAPDRSDVAQKILSLLHEQLK